MGFLSENILISWCTFRARRIWQVPRRRFFPSVWNAQSLDAVVPLDWVVASTPGHCPPQWIMKLWWHLVLCPSLVGMTTHLCCLGEGGWCAPVHPVSSTTSAFLTLLFRVFNMKNIKNVEIIYEKNSCTHIAFLNF